MMPSVRWCGLLGFCISALVHLAVAAAIFRNFGLDNDLAGSAHQVPVTLAMLDLGPEPQSAPFEVGKASAQQPDADTEVEPEADSEPETDFQPAPESELDPRTMAEQEPGPQSGHKLEPGSKLTSAPKPKQEIAAESKSEPQPKPEPKPKRSHKITAELKSGSRPRPKPKARSQSKPAMKAKSAPRRQADPDPRNTPAQVGKKKVSTAAGGATRSTKGGGDRGDGQNKALEKKYLAGLRRAIARKRRYPASAQRTGKTGVATVDFVLDKNGRITGASLGKSSGSSALDRAAVDTLRRLARYKPIPEVLGRTRWRLRVPIRFALK
jgi:protein TonB